MYSPIFAILVCICCGSLYSAIIRQWIFNYPWLHTYAIIFARMIVPNTHLASPYYFISKYRSWFTHNLLFLREKIHKWIVNIYNYKDLFAHSNEFQQANPCQTLISWLAFFLLLLLMLFLLLFLIFFSDRTDLTYWMIAKL